MVLSRCCRLRVVIVTFLRCVHMEVGQYVWFAVLTAVDYVCAANATEVDESRKKYKTQSYSVTVVIVLVNLMFVFLFMELATSTCINDATEQGSESQDVRLCVSPLLSLRVCAVLELPTWT